MAGSADQRASRRHATAAAGGRWAGRALTTIPGGGKDTEAHASARAAVRAAATAALAQPWRRVTSSIPRRRVVTKS